MSPVSERAMGLPARSGKERVLAAPDLSPDVAVALEQYVEDFLEFYGELSPAQLMPAGAAANVELGRGAAGLAYGLWLAADSLNRPLLLQPAAALMSEAQPRSSAGLSFARENSIAQSSVAFGLPGLHFTDALIAHALGNDTAVDAAIDAFAELFDPGSPHSDLYWGLAGTLTAATSLYRRTGSLQARACAGSAALTLIDRLEGLEASANYPRGLAHGLAGVYLALTSWHESCDGALPAGFPERILEFLVKSQQPAWLCGAAMQSALCAGVPGILHLAGRAYSAFGDDALLRAVAPSVDWTLQHLSTDDSICCGSAGVAHALHSLASASYSSPLHKSALACGITALMADRRQDCPIGLVDGEAGLFCLALELLGHARSSFDGILG